MCSVSHAQMQNSWIFDVGGLCTTACLTHTHNSLPSRTNAMNFACWLALLVPYSR